LNILLKFAKIREEKRKGVINFLQIILKLFEFCRVFEWKERVWERLGKI